MITWVLAAALARGETVALPSATAWTPDGPAWRTEDGALAAAGNGDDTTFWRTPPLPLKPGGLYALSFRARSPGGAGGTPVSGPVFCNRDLGALGPAWTEFRSAFVAPRAVGPANSWLRFGQWHLSGTAAFDGFVLATAVPVYAARDGVELGAGERLSGTVYAFEAPLGGASLNHARPLESHACGFNSSRWVFGAGADVTYRHEVAGRRQTAAVVMVSVTYREGGTLLVEAGASGTAWTEIGRLAAVGRAACTIPSSWLPAAAVRVRLRALGTREMGARSDPGSFQVGAYAYHAALVGPPLELTGVTRFLELTAEDPRLEVRVESLGEGLPGGRNEVTAWVTNRGRAPLAIRPLASARRAGGGGLASSYETLLKPRRELFRLPYHMDGPGAHDLTITFGPNVAYRARTVLAVPELYRAGFGERLPASSPGAALWWASSGWKISERCPPPDAAGASLRVSAAGGEAEGVQLVVRPTTALRGFLPAAGPLRGPGGAVLPASAVEFLRVAYVPVEHPTDAAGAAGRWPDPLPPLRAPLDLEPGRNQPVWIRVTVPRGTPAGTYAGELRLAAQGYLASATLLVEVYGFDLPLEPALKSAFGFDPWLAFRYHGAGDDAARRAVLERYWENFAAHRISPFAYGTAPLDPPVTTWTRTADGGGPVPRLEWDAWEREMARLFATHRFGAFALDVPGLGGDPPSLAGHPEGTPAYDAAFGRWCAAATARLAAQGWLDRAFVYWIDEPAEKDFPRVMTGMRRLALRLPRVARLLTKEPRPELEGPGAANLWCPILDAWDPKRVAVRRAAGDRFWWYICTGPKAPYPGEFIDHAAPELRVWCWQTWAEGVEGILIWATDYWTTPAAYPDPARPQNPYRDPMSWVREAPPGVRQPWGNGDGRFLYPPEAAADGRPARPVLDGPAPRQGSGSALSPSTNSGLSAAEALSPVEGPVDSIRWEHLRDGVEDYDYLALLHRRLAKASAADRARYAPLLEVPPAIARSLTEFARDPGPIESRRAELARAIAALAP